MTKICNDILFNLRKIENTIINDNNIDMVYLYDFNKILEKSLTKLTTKLYRNTFIDLPIEIIEKIFSFIDIKNLHYLKNISRYVYTIVNEYIRKNIFYCLIFEDDKNGIKESFYMLIRCDSCINIKKKSINSGTIGNSIVCSKCKYKLINYNNFKNIKNLEIKYRFNCRNIKKYILIIT